VIRATGGVGLVLIALLLALALAGSGASAPSPRGTYIVVLKESAGSVPAVAREQARRFGGDVRFVYGNALRGYAVSLPEAAAAALARLPIVDYVEADSVYTVDTTQSPVTWGLDRIDQRNRPLSNSFTYSNTGAGVTAYIIDTGITWQAVPQS
jgi:hypothetical protein